MNKPLSERLKAAAEEYESMGLDLHCPNGQLVTAVRNAAAVCALVEAFQAAERAYQAAVEEHRNCGTDASLDYQFEKLTALAKTKARLLGVNFG